MSDQNIFLSNGTCYTGPGQKLHESFIPCGNAAFGHITCCGAGDNCLADDACWGIHGTGYGSYLTYMAGCTDPEYKDPSCPKKIIGEYLAKSFRPCVRFGHELANQDGHWRRCRRRRGLHSRTARRVSYRRRRRRVPRRHDEGMTKASNPRMSAASTTPTASEADGRPISEADGNAARPWSMRSELEGSSVPAAGQPPHGGAAKVNGNHAEGGLSPVAELPGSEGWQR